MRRVSVARQLTAVVMGGVLLGGCANHPLVDDVTGYTTNDIVQKLRCEAQQAILAHLVKKHFTSDQENIHNLIRKKTGYDSWQANNKSVLSEIDSGIAADVEAIKAVKKQEDDLVPVIQGLVIEGLAIERLIATTSDEDTRKELLKQKKELLDKALKSNAMKVEFARQRADLEAARFDPEKPHNKLLKEKFGKTLKDYLRKTSEGEGVQKQIQAADLDSRSRRELFLINNTTLSMKLDFKITENDNAEASGMIVWPVPLGTFSLGYKGGKKMGRDAQRVVNTVSLFVELSDQAALGCAENQIDATDGRARPYPIVGNVGVEEFVAQYFKIIESINLATTGGESFTDTITFTTMLEGQLNPSVEIKPVSPNLVKASLDLNADRKDIHTVTLQIKPYAPRDDSQTKS